MFKFQDSGNWYETTLVQAKSIQDACTKMAKSIQNTSELVQPLRGEVQYSLSISTLCKEHQVAIGKKMEVTVNFYQEYQDGSNKYWCTDNVSPYYTVEELPDTDVMKIIR